MKFEVEIDAAGRIILPEGMIQNLNLKEGDRFIAVTEDGKLVLMSEPMVVYNRINSKYSEDFKRLAE